MYSMGNQTIGSCLSELRLNCFTLKCARRFAASPPFFGEEEFVVDSHLIANVILLLTGMQDVLLCS